MNNQLLIYFNMFDQAVFMQTCLPYVKELSTIHSIGKRFCVINMPYDLFAKKRLINQLKQDLPNALIKLKRTTKGQRKYLIIQQRS